MINDIGLRKEWDVSLDFINTLIAKEVLRFELVQSDQDPAAPFVFHRSKLDTGVMINEIGRPLAERFLRIEAEINQKINTIVAPSYSGIGLAMSMAASLNRDFGRQVSFVFERKGELKSDGFFTAPITGNCLVVDDMIRTGTSLRRVIERVRISGNVSGVLVALDRQRPGEIFPAISALQEIEKTLAVKTWRMVKLTDLLDILKNHNELVNHYQSMVAYIKNHCIIY